MTLGLRPRPDPDLRRAATTAPAIGRAARPLPALDLLRAAQPAADLGDHRADRRGPALRSRHAAAAVRQSGPIASSLAAFAQYQREAGLDLGAHGADAGAADRRRPSLCERVEAAIRAALTRRRDPERLLADVADMRRRIAERPSARPSPWDLRNRRGGLVDLEFTVQYLMLREAARQRPERAAARDPAAAIAALGAAGVLPPQGGARAAARRCRCCGMCARCWRCCSTASPDAASAGRHRPARHWRAAPARLTSPGSKTI